MIWGEDKAFRGSIGCVKVTRREVEVCQGFSWRVKVIRGEDKACQDSTGRVKVTQNEGKICRGVARRETFKAHGDAQPAAMHYKAHDDARSTSMHDKAYGDARPTAVQGAWRVTCMAMRFKRTVRQVTFTARSGKAHGDAHRGSR